MKRKVLVRVLPGTKTPRIHWFRRHPDGPIRTAARVEQVGTGRLVLGGAVGSIACSPAITSVAPALKNGIIHVIDHTDDPRAANCPECMATLEFGAAIAAMTEESTPCQPA